MVTYKISGNDKYRVITNCIPMNIFILSKNMIKIHIRINFILFSNLGQKISYPKNSKLS